MFLCTGNAARSVIAGAALAAAAPDVRVATAGTLVVEGQPMSTRTRAALEAVDLARPQHRSRQATERDLERADLVVALAPEHVAWVRRTHPAAAARTGTLRRLCRDLPGQQGALSDRVHGLDLAQADLEAWEEITDPGGGEVDAFVACAHEVKALVDQLAILLDHR